MSSNSEKECVKKSHWAIDKIYDYVVHKVYPKGATKNEKSNIRRLCKKYVAKSGQLFYIHQPHKKTGSNFDNSQEVRELQVIHNKEDQERIIRSVHSGTGDSDEARSLAGHLGIMKTQDKIMKRFYWKGISHDVKHFIQACERCQRVNPLQTKERSTLHPVAVPNGIMRQIGIDITSLPKTDEGYCCIVMGIDYFSKWPEARALKDKTAKSVATFIFEEIICRHGCIEIQINDQGREFVNTVSEELFRLTGTEQKVTSAYHAQSNGLVERQNRSLKDSLVKSLSCHKNWPQCLASTLFAYRSSKHASTKEAPFKILYGKEARLPVDCLKPSSNSTESPASESLEGSNSETGKFPVEEVINKMNEIRERMNEKVEKNIKIAQQKQKANYDKRREPNLYNISDKVLAKNMLRMDRKGGKFVDKYLGPYVIHAECGKNTYKLKNRDGIVLKKRFNGCNLKLFNEPQIPEKPSDSTPVEVEFEEPPPTLFYKPVCFEWQSCVCKMLGICVIRPTKFTHDGIPSVMPEHEQSYRTTRVIGDGNCLFRSLSQTICGCQDQHPVLRHQITKLMCEKAALFNGVHVQNMSSYLNTSKMTMPGVWGTEVEVFAAATLLQTLIYVYAPYGDRCKWVAFEPLEITGIKNCREGDCIYLVNTANHFEPLKLENV